MMTLLGSGRIFSVALNHPTTSRISRYGHQSLDALRLQKCPILRRFVPAVRYGVCELRAPGFFRDVVREFSLILVQVWLKGLGLSEDAPGTQKRASRNLAGLNR